MAVPWQPAASRAMLEARARLLAAIRAFMAERGILEVETPVLDRYGNPELHLHSFRAGADGGGAQPYYLQTSPEFAMKRLLAAGSGAIYQIVRVFRAGETGRRHQPEFTLLEWYRPGFDHQALMDELATLLQGLGLGEAGRRTYTEVFSEHTGLDPHGADTGELARAARALGLAGEERERSLLLDFLFSCQVAPVLGRERPCLVYDFPACQAALARIRPGPPPLAERFELFIDGMEIANGYNELQDVSEQESRFQVDNQARRARGLPEVPPDPRLLAALAAGLPACAGVAVGLDRLLMAASGAAAIDDVLAFPLPDTY